MFLVPKQPTDGRSGQLSHIVFLALSRMTDAFRLPKITYMYLVLKLRYKLTSDVVSDSWHGGSTVSPSHQFGF